MIFKKKEVLILFFLIFLQSCSGGRIGNFLQSSFDDLGKTNQGENLQKNLENEKFVMEEKKEINDGNKEKINEVIEQNVLQENKKDTNLEKVEKQENKKDINLEKVEKQKNKKVKNSTNKKNIELQSYKIIFILKNVDPKDPTEKLSNILSNSDLNFEIEKIERILESKNKNINKKK